MVKDDNQLFSISRLRIISREGFFLFVSLCLYKVIIEAVYIYRISPLYSYALLTTNTNINKMVYSWLLFILIFVAQPKNPNKPSTYLFLFMTLIMWIPLISYYWMNDMDSSYVTCEILCIIIISFWCRLMRTRRFLIGRSVSYSFFNAIFAIYTLMTVYLILKRGGIDLRALNFRNVYDIRDEYNNLRSIDGYLMNWSARALFPAMSSYMFLRRKKGPLALAFLLQIGLYMSYGHKTFLASTVLMIIVFVLVLKRKAIRKIITIFSVGNVVAYFLDVLGITIALRVFLPYRTLFVPVKNQFHYFEYFSSHDFLQLSGSALGRLFFSEYKYDRPIGYIVEAYFRNSGSNGNTGVFSYGFADFGFVGMLIVAVIIGFLFWLIDCTTDKLPLPVKVGAFSYWAVTMNDNSLLITIITGGLPILILIMMSMNTCNFFGDDKGLDEDFASG